MPNRKAAGTISNMLCATPSSAIATLIPEKQAALAGHLHYVTDPVNARWTTGIKRGSSSAISMVTTERPAAASR